MKSFIATSILALLASVSLAAPVAQDSSAVPTAQVALTNDQTGANANALVPLDGQTYNLSDLYAGTAIDPNGEILISSVMLTGGIANNPTCVFSKADGTPVTTIDFEQTYAKLGHNPNMLVIVDWSDFTITCA